MSGPPPNFNSNESLLPDPGRDVAPIHVMKGGARPGEVKLSYTDEELEILKQYGLAKDGPIAEEIDELTKREFLKQLANCKVGTGDSVILSKNCSAVLAVINALIKSSIKKQNSSDMSFSDNNTNSNTDSDFNANTLISNSTPEPAPAPTPEPAPAPASAPSPPENEDIPEQKTTLFKRLFTRKKKPLSSIPPNTLKTNQNTVDWINNPIGSVGRSTTRRNINNSKKNNSANSLENTTKNKSSIFKKLFTRKKKVLSSSFPADASNQNAVVWTNNPIGSTGRFRTMRKNRLPQPSTGGATKKQRYFRRLGKTATKSKPGKKK
jgi:hypothetical protein